MWRRPQLYQHWVRVAVAETIAGGIVFERYPETGCGLLTYLVVAPAARGQGVARQLVEHALAVLADAPAVFAEVNDPRTQTREPRVVAERRLAMFERWGARPLDTAYVQPALGPSLAPDTTLRLLAWGDPDPVLTAQFIDEFARVLHRSYADRD